MNRPIDRGIVERWAWIHYEQAQQVPRATCPFTLLDLVSAVLLGFLLVCVLILAAT